MSPRRVKPARISLGMVVLPMVIIFALVASVELARTVIAAEQINNRVADITGSVKGANTNLDTGCGVGQACGDALPVLSQTEAIAAKINEAAKPLSGEAQQILVSVDSINVTAAQILTTAMAINTTVHSINGIAGQINGSVNSIDGHIAGVDTAVVAIRGTTVAGSAFRSGVVGINNRADAVITLVDAIKGDTGPINSQAGGILTQAQGIGCDRILGLVGPISGTC